MAEEELDLDAKGSSKKKLIIMILLALVLVGGSVGITLMLVGGDSAPEEGEAEPEEVIQKPIYLPLEKIVSAFQQSSGGARFVQIEMELMAYDQAALDAVQTHMPAIRNDLLRIIGTQTYEVLNSEAGKEQLRGEIVTTIQTILGQHNYEGDGIQQVYFTSFVMQ